jgi:O-antigen/teichoic acid export membrane protein
VDPGSAGGSDPGGDAESRTAGASEIRHAIPLAIAAALVGLVSLLTTVFVAHVLSTRGYGTLIVLLGLFLVVSMPGSALLVGVVRRSTAWEVSGLGDRVKPWAARVHRIGEVSVVALALLMVLLRSPIAHALSLPSPNGVAEMLTAAGVWVLVSIDRGLLQVRRDYVNLSVNLVLEAVGRCTLTVALAAAFGVEGAALGQLFAELVTAVHARVFSARALARPSVLVAPVEEVPEIGVEATGGVVAVSVHGGRDLAADVLTALGSLVLLAVLQNADVILLGSKAPHHAGAYAAISVPSKALAFGALVLINYLLPEAAIRHQRGSHALRQLAHTFGVLSLPCALLMALAVFVPKRLLSIVFGHRLTAAAPAFSTLVLAMVFLSATLVLAIYLLGIGWRWVVLVLAVGAVALVGATAAAGGRYLSTARADLVVQAGLLATMTVCFVTVHRRGGRRRAELAGAPPGPAGSLA